MEEYQINPDAIDKSTKWYFHPDEHIRMLRYFQSNMKFNNNEDYSVHYTNNPNIGVVISTYGCVPYVDLQLYFLKQINHIDNILIHDDCSPDKDKLKELTKQYNVDFYSTPNRMWYKSFAGCIGDIDSIYQGLIWAKQKNIDVLVKLNRRLIPCFNWKDDLIKLVIKSDASTFSSYCTKNNYNFRTECIGLNVDIWTKPYALQCLSWTIENEYCVYSEFWMHELAKTLSGNNYSEKWKEYCNKNKFGYLHSGYAMWQDILGTNKSNTENRHDNVLWHMYSKPNDYLKMSDIIFSDKYTLKDFENCVTI